MNNLFKNLVIWLVIGLVLMTVFNQFNTRQQIQAVMDYSQFMEEVKAGRIAEVVIEGRDLKAKTTDGKPVNSYSPGDIWLVSDLLKYGVKIKAKREEEPSLLMNIFVSWFPMLLLIGVWIFFMRQMQGGGRGGAFSFGKSRARMIDESNNNITFADVAGCEERSPARQRCRSSPFQVRISWRCSSAWALLEFATCSTRRRSTRPASCS